MVSRLLAAMLVAAGAVACVVDSAGFNPAEAGSGSVTFRISVPSGGGSATRALSEFDEWAVDTRDIAVLLFTHPGKTFIGVYNGKVVAGPTGAGGSSATIDFSVSLPLGGDYNLMVVANSGAILGGSAAALVSGASQGSVEEALTAAMTAPGGWVTDPSDAASRIPMWGYASAVRSSEFVSDGSGEETARRFSRTIGLVRMVARIDVSLSRDLVEAGDFELRSVRVYNFNKTGRLIPDTDPATNGGFDWERVDADNLRGNTTPFIPSGPGVASDPATEWINRVVPPGATALRGEIYLFEAAKGVVPTAASDAHRANLCLVIGGSFEDGVVTYYRIDFANRSGDVWTYMPLLRNNLYAVTITGISAAGLPSEKDALESIPVNIDARVVDWAGGDGITTLLSNGVHMLGLSHDSFLLPGQAQDLPSRLNTLTVVTDYSGGWSAQVFDNEAGDGATPEGSGWLTLSVVSYPAADYPAGTATRLFVEAMDSAGPQNRTAWVHITAGSLIYKLPVTQTLVQPSVTITRTGTDDEISLLEFQSYDPTPQSFTVRWSPAEVPLEILRVMSGTDHFTWQDASTNTLTKLPAGGEFTFYIDPATQQLVYRTLGSMLIFVLPDSFGGVASAGINLIQRARLEGPFTLTLDEITSPSAVPPAGGTSAVSIRSIVSATLSSDDGGGEAIEAVPWTAQFSEDGGATWSDTPPAWLIDFPTSGDGHPDGETITFTVAEATVGPGLNSRPPRGTAGTPWNLANPAGGDTDQDTANCYIVPAPGHYSLPLVYGNSVRGGVRVSDSYTSPLTGYNTYNILQTFLRHDGNRINASYIYENSGFTTGATIEDAAAVWMDTGGLVTNVRLDAAKQHLVFEVPSATITSGNAVVAVRDLDGNIVWSWHIWVTGSDPTRTVAVTNYQGRTYNFMMENLGTVTDPAHDIFARRVEVRIAQRLHGGLSRRFAISSDGSAVRINNTFYQFGRKDPLPGIKSGYSIRFGESRYDTASGGLNVSTSPATIPQSIRNPHMFYVGNSASKYDWNYNTPSTEGMGYAYKQNLDNLWDIDNNTRSANNNTVNKTVYDPSPVGFRLPPSNAFTGFTTTGVRSVTPGAWNVVDPTTAAYERDGGWRFRTGASGESMLFSATGYLRYDTGALTGPAIGFHWSAGPINDGYGYYLQFNSGEVNPLGEGGRGMGVSVRPIAE
jgi:hypothetical protein